MDVLKNIILFIFSIAVMAFLLALTRSNNTTFGAYQPRVVGTWAEIWGKEGWESNVDYIDTIVVDKDDHGELLMYCTNKPNYSYDQISFDGKHFNFRMENTSGDDEDPFYVNYWMAFESNPNKLEGESRNTRNDHNFVRMLRIE